MVRHCRRDAHAILYRSFGQSRLAGCQTVGSSLVGQRLLVFDETVELYYGVLLDCSCCHAFKITATSISMKKALSISVFSFDHNLIQIYKYC
jgi:hypothetical protein